MLQRLALFILLVSAAPAAAQLPCANPVADPCVLDASVTVPVGIYDIRPRSLSVGNKQITVSGAGEFKILAANVTFQPGARFVATGTDGKTTVTLDASGTIDIQSQGTSKSKIDVSGNFGGGNVNLRSVGNLNVNGTLIANATNLLGFGGAITVTSSTGNILISGDPSEGLRSFGNAQGGGGSINIDATRGSVTVATQLVSKGGDCGSCEVSLNAGTDITTTAQIDMRASGIGDGGTFSASAGGNINLAGNVLANGSNDDLEGGFGGDFLVSADGSVTIGGRVELNGAGQDAAPGSTTGSVDGDGGSSYIFAGTSIQMNGPMFAISKGFGQGDELTFDSPGNITLAAEIDMTGDNFSGDVTVLSDALITVSARVRTATPVDPVNKPSSIGGTNDLEGCQIIVTPTGEIISTGPGGDPSGSNELYASTGMTIAGKLTATALNDLQWRTTAPVITGIVTPAATITQHPELPCCGVQCPTTTTTSTTSSTITLPPTTSSTSVPGPTTTTTTVVGPTSTTAPTTSTSSSSSSTLVSTSSTSPVSSSTLASTTSSTTVIATTSTSTVTVPTTTSTTSPPLTCLDTAVGIDAVRCRLDAMSDLIGHASEADLGGRKLARALSLRISKAKTLAADPPKTPRLKKATKQLKGFAIKLGKAVAAGKANATLGAELDGLATQAQTELAGLTT